MKSREIEEAYLREQQEKLVERMIETGKCPKCGSEKVIPQVRVLDRDGEYSDKSLSVRIDRNPDALLFKGREVVELSAKVCCECGYAEMYVTSTAALWSAFQEREGLSGPTETK